MSEYIDSSGAKDC